MKLLGIETLIMKIKYQVSNVHLGRYSNYYQVFVQFMKGCPVDIGIDIDVGI